MPRRIPLEPDTDAYLQQRSRHGIGGCAKNRIARCVLDEPRRYARATQICAVTYAGRAEFPKCARVSGCLGRTPSARRYYSLRESDESGASIRTGDRTGSFDRSIPRIQRSLTASSVTGPASRTGYIGCGRARPWRAPRADSSNPERTLSTAKPWPASAAMRTPAKPTSS